LVFADPQAKRKKPKEPIFFALARMEQIEINANFDELVQTNTTR
jgi:hypothetical protein